MRINHFSIYLQNTSNLVLMVAAAVGAYAALTAVRNWKHQQSWQQDHKLARETLIQLYKLRVLTDDLKNTASLANLEMLHGENRNFDDYETLKFTSISTLLNNSLEQLEDSLPIAKAKFAEAKFVWGGDFELLSSSLDLELAILLLAAQSRVHLCSFPDISKKSDPKYFEDSQREVLNFTPDIDGERSRLQEQLNKLENALKPKLGRPS